MHAFWSTDYLTKQGTLKQGAGGCSENDGHHYHVEVFWAMVVPSKLCCQQLGGKSRIQVCTSQSLNFWPGKKVLVYEVIFLTMCHSSIFPKHLFVCVNIYLMMFSCG